MSSDTILDDDGVAKLVKSGYSRVPIHEPGKKDAIVGMLLVKNLIQYDPEDAQAVSSFHLTPLPEASTDLTLLDCLNYFQQGRSHMILVSTHPGESRGALGVVTLEDVIEEMIGEEIVDETDIYVDVHNKIKVVRNRQTNNTPGQNWQPLIRGIIERRRKLGGPMKAPLRSSYGTVGIMDHDGSGKTDRKYGVPSTSVRAVDKVAIKRPGSPQSMASASRKNSGTYEPNAPLRRTSTSSVVTSIDGLNYQICTGRWCSRARQVGRTRTRNHTSSRWEVRIASRTLCAFRTFRSIPVQKSALGRTTKDAISKMAARGRSRTTA